MRYALLGLLVGAACAAWGAIGISGAYRSATVEHGWLLTAIVMYWITGVALGAYLASYVF